MDFLKKISRRERVLLVAAGAFILLAVVYRLVMIPVRDRNSRLDTRIESLDTNLDILETQAFQAAAVEEQYVHFKQTYQGQGTDKEQIAMLQQKLQTFASETGVLLAQIRPRPAKSDAWSHTYMVELTIEADAGQLMSFLHRLNTTPEAFRVDTFQLARKDKDPTKLKANLLVGKQVFSQDLAAK